MSSTNSDKPQLQVTLCRSGDSSDSTKRRRRHGVLSNKKAGSATAGGRCHCRLNNSGGSVSLSASSSRLLQLSACSSSGERRQQQQLLRQQFQYHQLQQLARLKSNNQDLARVNAGLQLASQKLASDTQRLQKENLQLRQRASRLPELRSNLFNVLDAVYKCVQLLGDETENSNIVAALAVEELEAHRHADSMAADAAAAAEFVDEEPVEVPAADSLACNSAVSPPRQFKPMQHQLPTRVVAAAPSGSVIAEVSAELVACNTTMSIAEEGCSFLDSSLPTAPAVSEDPVPLITDVEIVAETVEVTEPTPTPEPAAVKPPPQQQARKTSAKLTTKSKERTAKPKAEPRRRVKSAAVTPTTSTASSDDQRQRQRPARSTRRPVSYLEEPVPDTNHSPDLTKPDKKAGRPSRTVLAVQQRPGQLRYVVAVNSKQAVDSGANDAKAMPPPPPPRPSQASKTGRKRRLPQSPGAASSDAAASSSTSPSEDPFNLSANRTGNLSALPDSLQGLRERCQNAQQQQQQQQLPEAKKANHDINDGEQKQKKKKKPTRRQQRQLNDSDEADFVSLY